MLNTRLRASLSIVERILFYERLGLFLQSGISLAQAIEHAEVGHDRAVLRHMCEKLLASVMEGRSLAQALACFPRSIPRSEVGFIELGELCGNLPAMLEQIAGLLRKRRRLARSLFNTLSYPFIIIIAVVGIVSFLLLYIFPKILPIFIGMAVSLPLSTRLLISGSAFLSEYGLLLLAGLVIAATLTLFVIGRKAHRYIDFLSVRVPIVHSFVSSFQIALHFRTLSILLSSGIPIMPAVAQMAEGIHHTTYAEAFLGIESGVRSGRRLSQELERYPRLFPSLAIQLVAAGERTGSLPERLETCASFYEEELGEQMRTLVGFIEPTLMLIVGAIVGYIALSIISPIYSITQNLQLY